MKYFLELYQFTKNKRFNLNRILPGILLVYLFFPIAITAQPSGGPYGPIPQTYNLPEVKGKIIFVAPDGKPDIAGEKPNNPTTIETAIKSAKTGDAVILRGGTYRCGNLEFNQGITIQPYSDERPVLKGTKIAAEWKQISHNLWATDWDTFFPSAPADWWHRDHNSQITPLHRFNNDMVFVDGKFLQSAGWEGGVDENSYYIDYEREKVFIGINPTNHLVEITAFDVALHRVTTEVNGTISDKKGPIIKGLTITQYAYRAIEVEGIEPEGISSESVHGKEVIGTTLENCVISFCSRVAAYLRGDKLIIRNCKISDTSTEGIYVIASSDVLLEKNIFSHNNIENITGYFPAAVKIFNQSYRVTCNDNLIIDHPNSNGIWYDVGNVDGRFINNLVVNIGKKENMPRHDRLWPSENGFFFEISKGAICAGNVFINCDHGLMVLNSSDVQMYQNTFINSSACIGRDGRSAESDHFGWHPSSGPDVDERIGHVFINNLLYADDNFQRPLLFVWQNKDICNKITGQQLKQADYNVFCSNADQNSIPIILWGPATNDSCQLGFKTLKDFQKIYPAFSTKSKWINNNEILFKNPEFKDYKLAQPIKGANEASRLPESVIKILKLQKNYKPYLGAYTY